ncbi:SANT/Myb domain-containing protein [Hirschfeldia incana]|nr:SANT/Myb domain-containing protein [Hirschfeldia incana]
MADTEVINKWVAEFFIRRKTNPMVSPTNLLSALKFGDSSADDDDCSNLNLKKASVLRDISDSLIRGDVDEGTLDLLETFEKLLQEQGSSKVLLLTDSHKSAYCSTAVECTVKFMLPLSEGLYSDAVERIWAKRIGGLKESGKSGLVVSGELLRWEGDLRKAVEDAEVYRRIRESNVRDSAVCVLNQFLEEQWGKLGCSSLESVAQRLLSKRGKAADKGKAVDKGDGGGVRSSREDRNARRLDEGENGEDNRDVHGEEERTMGGAQEEEDEPNLLNKGDEMAARELKDYLLDIQRRIDPSSTRQVPEPITPQPSRVNSRTGGTSGQVSENSSRVRPRLPTPVPLNVSPLKKKRKASPLPRKKKKFWTPEEVEALRQGIKEHGKSWKYIKNSNPVVFADRTGVDLKDKWRNMMGQ